MLIQRFTFLLRPSGNIEFSRGIRTLFAIVLPIIVGAAINRAQLGLMVGLCAQILLLADVGDLYSVRAKTLIGTTMGVALALIVGTLVSSWFWLTILVILGGLFLAGYLTIYGENGAAAGLVIGLVLLFAITLSPGGIVLAIQRALIALLAGSWTITLALWFWPFQPNLPLRRVVAKNFQELAKHLYALPPLSSPFEHEDSSFAQVRQSLSQSRQTLTETKRGSWGHSDLRELLIVLIEDSDRIMTTLTTMRELIKLHSLPQLKTVEILLEDVLKQVASITEDIGQLILGKKKIPDCNRLKLLMEAIEQQHELQQKVLETDVRDYNSYVAVDQLKTLLRKLQQQLQLATQTAGQLHNRDHLSQSVKELQRSPSEGALWDESEKKWWNPLWENFSLESPLFRHALRLGLGSAIGVLIYTFVKIPHGLWIGLTLVIVLKPDFSLTFQRFFYRVIGTILGAGAVSILLANIHNPFWLELIGILSITIALCLIRFHYSLAVFFITLFVLLLNELHPDTHIGNVIESRLICTIIGAVLAFLLSFSFLRIKEELRFSNATVTAIEEINLYFQSVMAVYLGENLYAPNCLLQNRHKARLANITMQTALQRLIDDPSTPFNKIEPAITLTNYIPRLGRAITVLLIQLEQYKGSQPHPKVITFTQQVTEGLTQLAESLRENMLPLPLPPIDSNVQEIFSHLQQLQEKHLTEIANAQNGTSIYKYLRDYNIVINEFQEIARRLQAIHTAITRFET